MIFRSTYSFPIFPSRRTLIHGQIQKHATHPIHQPRRECITPYYKYNVHLRTSTKAILQRNRHWTVANSTALNMLAALFSDRSTYTFTKRNHSLFWNFINWNWLVPLPTWVAEMRVFRINLIANERFFSLLLPLVTPEVLVYRFRTQGRKPCLSFCASRVASPHALRPHPTPFPHIKQTHTFLFPTSAIYFLNRIVLMSCLNFVSCLLSVTRSLPHCGEARVRRPSVCRDAVCASAGSGVSQCVVCVCVCVCEREREREREGESFVYYMHAVKHYFHWLDHNRLTTVSLLSSRKQYVSFCV